jgi:hypothetical protein
MSSNDLQLIKKMGKKKVTRPILQYQNNGVLNKIMANNSVNTCYSYCVAPRPRAFFTNATAKTG